MAISVVMPALEMAQETGKLVSWLKQEGEPVAKGDMLLEIETDKAVMEIEALGDGILAGVTAKPGDVVPVGQTIAWLVAPGEATPAPAAPTQTGRKMDAPAATPSAAAPSGPAAVATAPGAARLSPRARRLAKEHGIDPSTIVGSGPSGEVQAEDILKIVEAGGQAAPAAAAAPVASAPALSTVGRIMAERTTTSWTTVPHFFVSRDVDASGLNAARERLIPVIERSHAVKVTHTDLLVAAVGRALRQHPRMNASWANNGIGLNEGVHVALAMAVDDAVVTAVIRDADRASLGEIAVRRRELTERARAGRLQPADISGGTFTISNLGMFGVSHFTAIIVPPQAAILAVGAIIDRVVPEAGQPAIRPYLTLTLSSDHRVIGGAGAAKFLSDVVGALQSPDGWAA